MTMHMIRARVVHKSKKRNRKPGWEKAEAEHQAFLDKMGIKQGIKSDYRYEMPSYKTENKVPTSDYVGNGFKRDGNTYTGTFIKGIATMHKSNMVPITSGKDAKEVARMRRG